VDADRSAPLSDLVLGWGLPRLRDLPWRATRDPWAVLVAEAMLQQTQVARVLERWPAFLEQFPSPALCAAATVGDVVRAWQGLGYNRRAVSLHRAATIVTVSHGGHLPESFGDLLALPGVGPYTARAVLVFAFEHDEAVVDTNIARVLARVSGRSLRPAEVQSTADELVPDGDGWAWNQVLMDLGSTVCTARIARCEQCPLAGGACAWQAAGRPEPDPAIGSAGVSGGQSRFDGSDRQGRGRLVRVLSQRAVTAAELATVMGWPSDHERAASVAATLVRDGLVTTASGWYRLT
jgi:A/G-specific adenine glycosylase